MAGRRAPQHGRVSTAGADVGATRSSRKTGWSPAAWNARWSRSWPHSGKPNKTWSPLKPAASPDHRGRTGMAVPPWRRHPGGVPRIRHGARGVSWTRSTARQKYELSIGWTWVPWSPPRVPLEGGAMSSVLVAGTARGPGAGIGQRAIRAAKDRLIAGVIPRVPASTRIPVAGRVGPARSGRSSPPSTAATWTGQSRTSFASWTR
jgi:hypothetical protein